MESIIIFNFLGVTYFLGYKGMNTSSSKVLRILNKSAFRYTYRVKNRSHILIRNVKTKILGNKNKPYSKSYN